MAAIFSRDGLASLVSTILLLVDTIQRSSFAIVQVGPTIGTNISYGAEVVSYKGLQVFLIIYFTGTRPSSRTCFLSTKQGLCLQKTLQHSSELHKGLLFVHISRKSISYFLFLLT